jgi:hypothetical protein
MVQKPTALVTPSGAVKKRSRQLFNDQLPTAIFKFGTPTSLV